MTILVTGGAGYIGAHVVRTLRNQGESVVVVDDLSYGKADRVAGSELIKLDVASPQAVETLTSALRDHQVSAVIHFAARKQVGESVEKPLWYFQQNVGGLTNVLTAMQAAGVDTLIFSSSAAAYGSPTTDVVSEDATSLPINPYGETKLIGEWLGRDAERAFGLRFVALRYFNFAGAGSPDLNDPAVLNLIPMVFQQLYQGGHPKLFGNDYPTPDGTCVRDYIHVQDLAEAHVAALDYAKRDDRQHDVFNVGTGEGSSVSQVLEEIKEVSGIDFPIDIEPRRAGDPAHLIGSPARINSELGWHARHDLHDIVESAWEAWQASPKRIDVDAARAGRPTR